MVPSKSWNIIAHEKVNLTCHLTFMKHFSYLKFPFRRPNFRSGCFNLQCLCVSYPGIISVNLAFKLSVIHSIRAVQREHHTEAMHGDVKLQGHYPQLKHLF